MSREKKKGTSGNAKAFITRAKALKKLQITLPEFRRLCILKGIYPRDPRKKFEGTDKTYYLRKDIDFLAHERLLGILRQQNAHKKKVVKARNTRRIDVLKRLVLNKPATRLDHLVVERYPTFVDAIRDLDDPLCIIALFANLPASRKHSITSARVVRCQKLLREFLHFVAETNAITRVFVSIKGYYYQANLCGQTVTWISPHRFSQVMPDDVDFSVMLTFLELYQCILSFVNFRLYTSKNLAYPPKIAREQDQNALELDAVHVERAVPKQNTSDTKDDAPPTISDQAVKAAEGALLESVEEESDEEEESEEKKKSTETKDGDEAQEVSIDDDIPEGVFAGKSIVLGREVPFVELEFVLRASGAKLVTREDNLPDGDDRLKPYTHWIVDRPKVSGKRDMSLEYVQPQYVFDSINAQILLPTALYAPGAHLPPHLSPFVSEEDDGGYRPWFSTIIERIKAGDQSVIKEAAEMVYSQGEKLAKSKAEAEKQAAQSRKKKQRTEAENTDDKQKDTSMSEVTEDSDSNEGEDEGESKGGSEAREMDDDNADVENKSEEDNDEEDVEGEEEKMQTDSAKLQEEEQKEMVSTMLSRKKLRRYRGKQKAENAKAAIREKLSEKRRRLEEDTTDSKKSKRAKRRKSVSS